MGLDPGFCLLARSRDLLPGHLRSQPLKSRFAVLVTLRERDCRPEVGFGKILRDSTPCPIVSAERSLRDNMPLFGGAQEPLHGLHVIPRNALSVVVAHAHLPLRVSISPISELVQASQGIRLRSMIGRALS